MFSPLSPSASSPIKAHSAESKLINLYQPHLSSSHANPQIAHISPYKVNTFNRCSVDAHILTVIISIQLCIYHLALNLTFIDHLHQVVIIIVEQIAGSKQEISKDIQTKSVFWHVNHGLCHKPAVVYRQIHVCLIKRHIVYLINLIEHVRHTFSWQAGCKIAQVVKHPVRFMKHKTHRHLDIFRLQVKLKTAFLFVDDIPNLQFFKQFRHHFLEIFHKRYILKLRQSYSITIFFGIRFQEKSMPKRSYHRKSVNIFLILINFKS